MSGAVSIFLGLEPAYAEAVSSQESFVTTEFSTDAAILPDFVSLDIFSLTYPISVVTPVYYSSTPVMMSEPVDTDYYSAPLPAMEPAVGYYEAVPAPSYPQMEGGPLLAEPFPLAGPTAMPTHVDVDSVTTTDIIVGEISIETADTTTTTAEGTRWNKTTADDEEKLQQFLELYRKIKPGNASGAEWARAFSQTIQEFRQFMEASWWDFLSHRNGRSEEVIDSLLTALATLPDLTPQQRIDALKSIQTILLHMRDPALASYTEKLFHHMIAIELFKPEPIKTFCTVFPTDDSIPEIQGLSGPARDMIPHALLQGYLRTRTRARDEHWRLFRYFDSLSRDQSAVLPFYQVMAGEIGGEHEESMNWVNAIADKFLRLSTAESRAAYKLVLRNSGVVTALALRSAKSGDDAADIVAGFLDMPDEGIPHWPLIMSGLVNNSASRISVRHLQALRAIAATNADEKERMKTTCLDWLRRAEVGSPTARALAELNFELSRLP